MWVKMNSRINMSGLVKIYTNTSSLYSRRSFLSHFDGVNNEPYTTDVYNHNMYVVGTTYGNTYVSNTQSKFGGTSLYVSNNHPMRVNVEYDFFSYPSGTDFTWEGWFNRSNTNSMTLISAASGVLKLTYNIVGVNRILAFALNGANIVSYTTALNTGQWYHVAVTRYQGTYYLYLDGVLRAVNSSYSTDISTSTDYFEIGGQYGVANTFAGYIDEVRINANIARYYGGTIGDTVFTPSTSAYTEDTTDIDPSTIKTLCDSNWNDVVFYSDFTGFTSTTNIVDKTAAQLPIAFTHAAYLTTTTSRWGLSSLVSYPPTSGPARAVATATVDSSFFNYGTNDDFTWEGWFYYSSLAGPKFFMGKYTSTSNRLCLMMPLGSPETLYFYNNSDTILSTPLPAINQWHHIAVTRTSGTYRLFVDGNVAATNSSYSTNINKTYTSFEIGGTEGISSNTLRGFIDDVRITKNVSRYSANFDLNTTIPNAFNANDCNNIPAPSPQVTIVESNKWFVYTPGYVLGTGMTTGTITSTVPTSGLQLDPANPGAFLSSEDVSGVPYISVDALTNSSPTNGYELVLDYEITKQITRGTEQGPPRGTALGGAGRRKITGLPKPEIQTSGGPRSGSPPPTIQDPSGDDKNGPDKRPFIPKEPNNPNPTIRPFTGLKATVVESVGSYTGDSTFAAPSGYEWYTVELWGAGGGSGGGGGGTKPSGAAIYYSGGGGGGGGAGEQKLIVDKDYTPGETVTISLGTGGTAGVQGAGGNGTNASPGTAGGSGTSTTVSIGTESYTASGGAGGQGGTGATVSSPTSGAHGTGGAGGATYNLGGTGGGLPAMAGANGAGDYGKAGGGAGGATGGGGGGAAPNADTSTTATNLGNGGNGGGGGTGSPGPGFIGTAGGRGAGAGGGGGGRGTNQAGANGQVGGNGYARVTFAKWEREYNNADWAPIP